MRRITGSFMNPSTRTVPTAWANGLAAEQSRTSAWMQGLAFLFGFFSQFDILVGGNGEGAAATGGYGYRVSDLLCVVAIGLLGIRALSPRRLVPLAIFSIIIVAIAFIRILGPSLNGDRSGVLAIHYLAYSFAALYLVTILEQKAARERFCWGLILGLLASVPVFILQGTDHVGELVSLGLIPGNFQVLHLDVGGPLRYSGLWGHPNEAGHVAALAAPAGAYFFFVQRRILPTALIAGALFVIFYYTQSRGGLMVGGGVLAIPFLFSQRGKINVFRFVIAGLAILISVVLISHLDFISSRFEDAGTAGNFAERLNTIQFGLETVLAHPFGLSLTDFELIMASGTGGVPGSHDGLIFFGAIFGWLPLAFLITAVVRSLSVRSDADVFFALIASGLLFSSLFEEVPASYPFAFVICMIVGWAFLKTRIGGDLRMTTFAYRRTGSLVGRSFQSASRWRTDQMLGRR